MISAARVRVTTRRFWLPALAAAALMVASASVAMAQQQINAGTNAQDAAAALNEGCVDMSKCHWEQTSAKTDWGPWKILGDKLYNCSTTAEAVTTTDVHQSRGSSTSVSEKLSVEVSLGFLNLASTSLTASGFSQQGSGATTTVSIGNGVPVSPGYVGWAESQVMSSVSTGTADITDGVNLNTKVTGLTMVFPAIDKNSKQAQAQTSTYSRPMTLTTAPPIRPGLPGSTSAGEYEQYCPDVEATPSSVANPATARAAARPRALREKPFKLTVCHATTPHKSRCHRRVVKGLLPKRHHMRRVTATLERSGRVHARDTDRRGSIRLTQRRDIKAGRYQLVVKKKRVNVWARNRKGKKLYRANTQEITIIPVTIRWKQKR